MEYFRDLGDGTRIKVDVVVVATGFEPSSVLAEDIMGEELIAKIGEVGALDEEGERIAVSVISCGFLGFCCLTLLFSGGDLQLYPDSGI
jgi:hypothetical protein